MKLKNSWGATLSFFTALQGKGKMKRGVLMIRCDLFFLCNHPSMQKTLYKGESSMHTQIPTVTNGETSWQCICAVRILYHFFVNAAMKPNLEWKKGEKIGVHITSHVCSEPGQLQLDGESQQLLLSPRAGQCGQGRGKRRFSWKRGGNQDEILWYLLQIKETNSKDQRSSFPLSGYINMFFIQVTEGLQN